MSPAETPEEIRAEERRLVAQSLQGDRGAYGKLVERYQAAAKAFAFGVVGDFHMAEDVAQEAFIRAFEALGTLENRERFGAWLRSIVRHTATDLLRRNHWTLSIEEMAEGGFDIADTTESPPSTVADEELRDLVLKALASLRSDYREIIVLRHIEQRSYREIADLLDMTTSAVGEKLSRVRELLRRKLRALVRPARPQMKENGKE